MTKLLTITATLLTTLALAARAAAGPVGTTWVEDGDAGQLPATAQVVQSVGGALTAILGTIDTPNDVDMYLIHIPNPAAFSATTVGQPGTLFDTQLFLFNQQGFGLEANDDVSTTDLRSTLTAVTNPTLEGNYLLAISAFNADPVVPGGLRIFPEPEETLSPFGLPVGPTGPGGGLPVADWTATGLSSGTYQIALVGAEFFVIPEPGTVLLWGLVAVAGFGLWRRNRVA